MSRYRQLDERQILETIARLRNRVEERFPGSGLGRITGELHALASEATELLAYLRAPNWPLRAGVALAIVAMIALLVAAALTLRVEARVDGLPEVFQLIESAINDVIFLGIAIYS